MRDAAPAAAVTAAVAVVAAIGMGVLFRKVLLLGGTTDIRAAAVAQHAGLGRFL